MYYVKEDKQIQESVELNRKHYVNRKTNESLFNGILNYGKPNDNK